MVTNTDNSTIYSTPPLAGRPPFATDDDHLYDQEPQPAPRRIRQSPSPDPNSRTSAYNVYVPLMSPITTGIVPYAPSRFLQLRQLFGRVGSCIRNVFAGQKHVEQWEGR